MAARVISRDRAIVETMQVTQEDLQGHSELLPGGPPGVRDYGPPALGAKDDLPEKEHFAE